MVAAGTTNPQGRRRAIRLIEAVVVIAFLGVGGAFLASAVQAARNAAHASATL